jgi:hypothetical protein
MKNCINCEHYNVCIIPYKSYKITADHDNMFKSNPLKCGVLNIYAESCKEYKIK